MPYPSSRPNGPDVPSRVARVARALVVAGFVVAFTAAAIPAHAQSNAETPARDLHEKIVHVDVTVKDLYGRSATNAMPITIYRPDGAGPFPFVVFNHGRAPAAKRAEQKRSRPEALARYLAAKGFVVLAPTRIGYGETYGAFDPEDTGGRCANLRLESMVEAGTDEVLATVDYAKTLPYVDATRWIVAGQSVGGLLTIATVARHPAGLLAGINFAGGTGGDPALHPARPCDPRRVEALYRTSGASSAAVPMLWMYWANDLYWGEALPPLWFDAWKKAGGQGTFEAFAARGEDGHNGMNVDLDHWVPKVNAFLAALGFPAAAPSGRPAASGYATIDDVGHLPFRSTSLAAGYRKFLETKSPRAFAIGDQGAFGYAVNDAVTTRALGFCTHSGQSCKLYAVDDEVVWQ